MVAAVFADVMFFRQPNDTTTAVVNPTASSFAFLNPFGEVVFSDFIHLPIAGELVVAILFTLLFCGILLLLTIWENRAVAQNHELQYRKHFINVAIRAFGTVIGWSWSVLIAVIYDNVVATWSVSEWPWTSGKEYFGVRKMFFHLYSIKSYLQTI